MSWPPKIVQKLTFWALALCQSDWRNSGLFVGGMAQTCHIGPLMGQKLQWPVAKTQTNLKKADNNSTNCKHSCHNRLVFFGKSFHLLLGQLLYFYPPLMSTRLMISNHICDGNENDSQNSDKACFRIKY